MIVPIEIKFKNPPVIGDDGCVIGFCTEVFIKHDGKNFFTRLNYYVEPNSANAILQIADFKRRQGIS